MSDVGEHFLAQGDRLLSNATFFNNVLTNFISVNWSPHGIQSGCA